VERDTEVRLLVLAALAGEHVLFIGPPGTAKSEVGRRLSGLIEGQYFERLLTWFSVPEVGGGHGRSRASGWWPRRRRGAERSSSFWPRCGGGVLDTPCGLTMCLLTCAASRCITLSLL
jgi:hypothetical protein